MWVLILVIVALAVLLGIADIRRQWVTTPIFKFFKKILPPMSITEQEAMESGDVWWDGELFCGKPDWQRLHGFNKPRLSEREQAFMDNEVETLLAMVDDYKITREDRDLPKEVWDYIKANGFFAMIIPKKNTVV